MPAGPEDLLRLSNPWLADPARQADLLAARLPEPFVPRAVPVEPRPGRLLLVVGPRQAGKSTLLLDAARRQDRPLVLVNAEEPALRGLCRSPAGFLAWLSERVIDRPAFLLFEEVQHVPDAALFLKGLVDLRPPHALAATGSASYHLLDRTRESLAGRAERVRLLPLSCAEVVAAGRPATPLAREVLGRSTWERQLRFGGYPAVWLSDRPELELARLAEAFVLRDASDLFRVGDLDAFRTVLRLAAADVGQPVNLSGWAAEAGVARTTVARWLDQCEEAHLVRRVRPFLGGKRAELKGVPKVSFLDCGLRNAVFGGFSPAGDRADGGALAETWVVAEVTKATGLLDVVRYWRTRNGAEVDLVVDRPHGRIAIEVKLGGLREPRLPRPARAFCELYRPDLLLLVNASLSAAAEHAGVPVRYCRPWELGGLLAPPPFG